MNLKDIEEFFPAGSKVKIISHGESVIGTIKKLSSPSSIILLRADNNKPKIIDCEKIENIDSADDENFSPDLKQEILPAVQTKKEPLATPLIYLPQIEQPQFFHREYLKMHFKKYRGYEKLQGVISEWNQLVDTPHA